MISCPADTGWNSIRCRSDEFDWMANTDVFANPFFKKLFINFTNKTKQQKPHLVDNA